MGILIFKGSFTLGGSNVKAIFRKKSARSRLLRVQIWRLFDPHSEFIILHKGIARDY